MEKFTHFVSVSSDDVQIVPPTSMWTGAVQREAAATQGIPVILWLQLRAGGVGDEELDMVGDVAGELLGESNLKPDQQPVGANGKALVHLLKMRIFQHKYNLTAEFISLQKETTEFSIFHFIS